MSDQACGSGTLLLAAADHFASLGFNPSEHLVVQAADLDMRCVHMTYLNLALHGIPAVVVRGDTITLEEYDRWYKPTNERISRMKKAETGGKKLDEMTLRSILDDKDIAPKQPEPVKQPEAPAAPAPGTAPETTGAATNQPPIPASPDVPAADVPPPRIFPRGKQPPPRSREPYRPPPALPRRKRRTTR